MIAISEASDLRLTFSVMMFILGFIAILLGLIAELLMRTYYESQAKPTYNVRKVTEIKR